MVGAESSAQLETGVSATGLHVLPTQLCQCQCQAQAQASSLETTTSLCVGAHVHQSHHIITAACCLELCSEFSLPPPPPNAFWPAKAEAHPASSTTAHAHHQ